MVDYQIFGHIDALLLRYTQALDERNMTAWAACFADEASYICTSRENVDQELPIAMMMDDSRARIDDRVKAVTKVWAGTFEDYTTRHLVQRVSCDAATDARWAVKSNFIIAYTNEAADTKLLCAGTYIDEIIEEGGTFRFASRTAILDADAPPRYLAYPI